VITALPRIAIAVRSLPAALAVFREGFGIPVVDLSTGPAASLGAGIALGVAPGASNLELMAPVDPSAPLAVALQRFLDRRGEGLYALMLEAPVPDDEAETLRGRGVEVLELMPGAGGRDIHPRSTHGVLVRVYPERSASYPAEASQAPGLSGIQAAIVAVRDAERAAQAWGHGLGLTVTEPADDPRRGVRVITCRAPHGADVELTSVIDPSRAFAQDLDRWLTEGPGGLYGLVLHAADPAVALDALEGRGLCVAREPEPSVIAFGTRFLLRRSA